MTCQKSLAPLPGCDHHAPFQTPGVASLHAGLISLQPSGLRSARRRRASKLARGERAKRATPGNSFDFRRTPAGCEEYQAVFLMLCKFGVEFRSSEGRALARIGLHEILFNLSLENECVTVEVEDDGPPFKPLDAP